MIAAIFFSVNHIMRTNTFTLVTEHADFLNNWDRRIIDVRGKFLTVTPSNKFSYTNTGDGIITIKYASKNGSTIVMDQRNYKPDNDHTSTVILKGIKPSDVVKPTGGVPQAGPGEPGVWRPGMPKLCGPGCSRDHCDHPSGGCLGCSYCANVVKPTGGVPQAGPGEPGVWRPGMPKLCGPGCSRDHCDHPSGGCLGCSYCANVVKPTGGVPQAGPGGATLTSNGSNPNPNPNPRGTGGGGDDTTDDFMGVGVSQNVVLLGLGGTIMAAAALML